jgi:cardiolipin synthase
MRNHRKILVVDGLVGFTGGLNIGDEYRGRKKHLAPWRDTHLRLEGPAVQTLQEIFIEDWFYADGEDMIDEAYFPPPQTAGEDVVQVAASGPDLPKSPIHRIFFTAVNQAQKTVRITTPYFVPDPALLMALKTAVWRGVKVEVLLPGKSDLPLVAMAGRSYYKELLEDDVVVYELRPGVLHAKTMVVDGKWSTVGSANMDIRSFQLNFEVNVMIWGESFAARLEDIFNQDLAASQRVTEAQINNRSWPRKASEAVIRVLSPVL